METDLYHAAAYARSAARGGWRDAYICGESPGEGLPTAGRKFGPAAGDDRFRTTALILE